MSKLNRIYITAIIILAFLCESLPAFAAQYTYDSLGRVTSATYNSGQTITYTYDAGGNILTQASKGGTQFSLEKIGNKSVNEGQALQFTLHTTGTQRTITYSAESLPEGAKLDSSSGDFSWTPNYTQSGAYNVTFKATLGTNTASEALTITVNNVNRPPVLAPIGDKQAKAGELMQFTVSATDPDGDKLTIAASNLPSGASFNQATSQFTWTPSVNQSVYNSVYSTVYYQSYSNVRFTVSDGISTDDESIKITAAVEMLKNPSFTTDTAGWSFWTESGASANFSRVTSDFDTSPAATRIDCTSKGSNLTNIQLYTTGLKIFAGKKYKLSFMAKTTAGTANPSIILMQAASPWKAYDSTKNVSIGTSWQAYTVSFIANSTDVSGRLTFYLGGKMPDGSSLIIDTLSFTQTE